MMTDSKIFEEEETINNICKQAVIRVRNKHPVCILIDGGLSTGKTTCAIHLADKINKINNFPELDLTEKENIQYAIGGEDFINKFRQCYEKKLPVIIYDEAGDYSRTSTLTKFNRTLSRVFDTFRAYQIILIICLPSIAKISKDLFAKNIPTMLFHLKPRKNTYGIAKVYEAKSMHYILHNLTKEVFPESAYDKVYCNFKTRFIDLDKERSKLLDAMSTKGKLSILENSEVQLRGLLSYKEISRQLGVSEIWIKKHIKETKIEPELILKKKKYYPSYTLETLRNKIKK